MIQEWDKFKGWSVMEYFLLNPNTKIHVNGLSRELKISTRTAQVFCNGYHEDGILLKEEVGNIHQFSLNGDDQRALALKRFMGPFLVSDKSCLKPFLKKNGNVLSVSIYGSFASGEYGDMSDLDILVLTADEKQPETRDIASIELRLGREVAVTSISLAKWRAMERRKDSFFLSVRKSAITVWGNPI
jgi:predicted nucleotidyltransferase